MTYSGRVDIQQVIDESPFSGFHWLLIVLGFLVLAIDGFDTAAMGYIAPTLSAEWGIHKQDLGPVLSAALLGLSLELLLQVRYRTVWDASAYWSFHACSSAWRAWARPGRKV